MGVLSTPAGAAFRGANGLIAFTRIGQSGESVGIVRPDGTDIATIVENASSPAWSPDGTTLVFQRDTGGGTDLFVIRSDGTGLRRINHPSHNDFLSAWAPDGKRIVFTSDPAAEPITALSEIYIVNADGRNRHRLTRNRIMDHSPVWSPDGGRIAFVRGGGPKPGIYSMTTSGKRLMRLTRNRSDTAPSWSPDGRLIAFDRERYNSGSDIFVMNRNGSNVHAVVEGETGDFMPAWSPDGTRLAFSRNVDTEDNVIEAIYVMDLDGGNVSPLVVDADDTFGPDWQPLTAP